MTGPRTRSRALLVLAGLAAVTALGGGAAAALISRGSSRVATPAERATSPATPTTPSTAVPPAPTTSTTEAPTTTTTTPAQPLDDGALTLGEAGPEVAALQARLDELGYWHATSDGTYGQLTRQAVMAFQKAEGLGRDGVAGPVTRFALGAAHRQVPQEPSGNHIEVDLARQILIVVSSGQTRWVLNTSTGSGEAYASPSGGDAVANTPTGTFAIDREVNGIREAPLGTLYRPKYFHGGIAIHGSGSIPAHPASHGCVRVTNSAMDLLWSSGVASIGTPVLVH